MYAISAGAVIEAAYLKPAEIIVFGPLGGTFSGLTLEISPALEANAMAMGRKKRKLATMQKKNDHPRLQYVTMTGRDEIDGRAGLERTPDEAGAEV